jgi:pantoate--beta-alanine ligase
LALPPHVHDSIDGIRAAVRAARGRGERVGLVPTMGALHEGHLRLMRAARTECQFVAVSIFVNPTQFGAGEDYERYPRSLESDASQCTTAGASAVFAPTVETMYPHGLISTWVEVPGLSERLEGASRPGHFRGVATVVLKLLHIVQPDAAWFGEKDYQQLQVIRRMVADLAVPVTIQALPTVREHDGLAMSSRNRYLGLAERRAAQVLSRALAAARNAVRQGERDVERVRQAMRNTLESEPLAQVDYAEVADAESLAPISVLAPERLAVALLAVRVGPARLIDNCVLSPS